MITKTLKVYGLVNFLNRIKSYLRTFNPLAAGSIPARPTKNKKGFRQLAGDLFLCLPAAKSTKVYVLAGAVALMGVVCPVPAHAGWDFYFFGINTKMIKEANYKMVALGVVTSLAVHTAGHYAYAAANGMDMRQEGLYEVVGADYSAKQQRESGQAGFFAQHLVGLALTTIPATRQTDFTRGYVACAFFNTLLYPVFDQGKGDLTSSAQYGGDRDWEYAAYMLLATHNVLRVKWYKE